MYQRSPAYTCQPTWVEQVLYMHMCVSVCLCHRRHRCSISQVQWTVTAGGRTRLGPLRPDMRCPAWVMEAGGLSVDGALESDGWEGASLAAPCCDSLQMFSNNVYQREPPAMDDTHLFPVKQGSRGHPSTHTPESSQTDRSSPSIQNGLGGRDTVCQLWSADGWHVYRQSTGWRSILSLKVDRAIVLSPYFIHYQLEENKW